MWSLSRGFFDFFQNLLGAFQRPSLNFCTKYSTASGKRQEFSSEKLHNFGRF
nr:MAG TPA: hypothetical protein [Caudoviricetes sp.]